ncbi:MAG TPA: serine hydrolase [Gemmatimonadaceae bacterium]|jgi:CubicO group peptidase (beta-lactamase class C family)|nr:serine hydrolase [Gemmatimonadaceae bacterium]
MMYTALLAIALAAPAGLGLPVVAPNTVGMSATRLAAIDRVVNHGIAAGGYPGAAVVVGRQGSAVLERGYGRLSWSSTSPLVNANETIYDIASLTKVVGTTTAIMILYDEGKISLDAPVSRYLPAFAGGEKDQITLRLLLTHRSGLPAGRDIWRMTHDPEIAKQIILSTPLEYRPGSGYVYSDLGADILGMVVEAVSGERLDHFLAERVFQPLGMEHTFFCPDDSLKERIAPTEIAPPRGYPLQGEVHDENAYAMGGIAGHAGLFSTASDLAVFAQMLLNHGEYNGVRIVADSTVTLFTKRAAGHRALGWDTATGEYGSGRYLSDDAFGHTGFTGTSIWIDPDRKMFVVLLTNRVHAPKALHPLRIISDVRSDLSDAAALAVTDLPGGPLGMPDAFRADREIGWNEAPVRSPHRHTRHQHGRPLSSKHGHRATTSHTHAHATPRVSHSSGHSKHKRTKH